MAYKIKDVLIYAWVVVYIYKFYKLVESTTTQGYVTSVMYLGRRENSRRTVGGILFDKKY